jgi:uncharacterized protein YciI
MPLFALYALDKPAPSGRAEHVEAHRAGLTQLDRQGLIAFGGPLLDAPGGAPVGSLVVFEAANEAEARRIVEQDPYVVQGVWANWRIHPVAKVFPKLAGA